MKLSQIVLRVRSPERLAQFYTGALGMSARALSDGIQLSYPGQGAALVLQPAPADGVYQHARNDRYWKIGITLPNVDIAYGQLGAAGVEVSEPRQFQDIGYMCHLMDPDGFVIELLQHHFQANRPAGAGIPDQPLGGAAGIGQITLRTTDIAAALTFYRDRLGMQLLSIQPVAQFDFTLYFLAFTDELPPDANLEAVENREWLWQRPYTTLEIQHLQKPDASINLPKDSGPGFGGLGISGTRSPEKHLQDDAGGRVTLIT